MLTRIARLLSASLVAALVLSSAARASAEKGRSSRALVVLIGNAGTSEGLRSVLSELLERQGVAVEYEERAHFSPSALLSESRDTRVWVFVSQPGSRVAKLYFRGPSGARFLLRQLALKNGLDEVGRELIGQVVETSTVALLHSNAGVTRQEARAGLSAEDDDEPSSHDPESPTVEPPPETSDANTVAATSGSARPEFELDARGFAKWAGRDLGVDHGAGVDAAVAFRLRRRLFLRGRAGFEEGFGQSIETTDLDGDVHTTSLRAGVDVGTAFGVNAVSVGALAGADFTKVAPKASADPDLALAGASTGTVPVIRLEVRYEVRLGAFCATAGVFGDGALAETHYDVRDPSGQHRVAAPWPVRPGMALTVGFRTGL